MQLEREAASLSWDEHYWFVSVLVRLVTYLIAALAGTAGRPEPYLTITTKGESRKGLLPSDIENVSMFFFSQWKSDTKSSNTTSTHIGAR